MASRSMIKCGGLRGQGKALVEGLEPRLLMSAVSAASLLRVGGTPAGIVSGPDGAIWYAKGASIERLAMNGSVTDYALSGGTVVSNLVCTSEGGVWFAVNTGSGDRVERLNNDRSVTPVTAPVSADIGLLAVSASDAVWFTQGNDQIGVIDKNGQVFMSTVTNGSGFAGLTIGPDGNAWFSGDFATGGGGFVGEVSAGGMASVYPLAQRPAGLAVGADGAVYVGGNDQITRVGKVGGAWQVTSLAEQGITATHLVGAESGGEAVIWFIDQRNVLNPITELEADGTVRAYGVGMPYAGLNALALGPAARGAQAGLWYSGTAGVVGNMAVEGGLLGRGVQLVAHSQDDLGPVVVGSFVDAAGSATGFVATIDWGDGSSGAGTVVQNGAGGFDVVADHVFAGWGWKGVSVHVAEGGAGRRVVDVESMVYVVPPGMVGEGVAISPRAGEAFSGVVANCAGLDAAALSQYQATIAWGDGQQSAGMLAVDAGGTVTVSGNHAYVRMGLYDIKVELTEKDGGWPAAWGPEQSVTTSPVGVTPISWAVFTPGTRGLITTNFSGNSMPITVPITWPTGVSNNVETIMGRAVVTAGAIDGRISLSGSGAVDGAGYNGMVAQFTFQGPSQDVGTLRAEIDWGDGSAVSAGTLTATAGGFSVAGQHTYMSTGSPDMIVRIYDNSAADGRQMDVALGAIMVGSHLSVSTVSIAPIAGAEFDGQVATITSVGAGWNNAFTVTISWGDGTSEGTVVDQGNGVYAVMGSHTFTKYGFNYGTTVSVSVKETRTRGDGGAMQSWASAYSWDVVRAGTIDGPVIHHVNCYGMWVVAGQATDLQLAALTLPPGVSAGDVTGSVKWDDGSTSALRLVADENTWIAQGTGGWSFPDSHSGYDVWTSVTFSAGGARSGVITLTVAGKTTTANVAITVSVPTPPVPTPQPLADVVVNNQSAYKGEAFSGVVGKFRLSSNAGVAAADLTVKILWGDGTSSPGSISQANDGWWEVSGTHTYMEMDSTNCDYTLAITLADGAGHWAQGMASMVVTPDPNCIRVDGASMPNFRQNEAFTTKVATLTPPAKSSAQASDYVVTIDWGDGTTSAGTLTPAYGGGYDIAGTHKYGREGSMNVTVTVAGPGGPTVAQSSVFITHNPVIIVAGPGLSVDGNTVSGVVGTFTDGDGGPADPKTSVVFHTALIDWGDGTTSEGKVVARNDGGFDVQGTHAYATEGDYQLTLIVRRSMRYLPAMGGAVISDFVVGRSWFVGQVFYGGATSGNHGFTGSAGAGLVFDSAAGSVSAIAGGGSTSTVQNVDTDATYQNSVGTVHIGGRPAPERGNGQGGGRPATGRGNGESGGEAPVDSKPVEMQVTGVGATSDGPSSGNRGPITTTISVIDDGKRRQELRQINATDPSVFVGEFSVGGKTLPATTQMAPKVETDHVDERLNPPVTITGAPGEDDPAASEDSDVSKVMSVNVEEAPLATVAPTVRQEPTRDAKRGAASWASVGWKLESLGLLVAGMSVSARLGAWRRRRQVRSAHQFGDMLLPTCPRKKPAVRKTGGFISRLSRP